eukprot:1141072-Pelagomonas_calceolata.AAC.2
MDSHAGCVLLEPRVEWSVFLIAATRRDLATNVHFRVRHRDARQGVPEHPASPRCDAEISGEYPV